MIIVLDVNTNMTHISTIEPTSPAYKEGYNAYKSWYHTGGPPPFNPYDADAGADEKRNWADWYQGWEDASFEF